MKLSFCTTCMGRVHHLQQTLAQNLADAVNWDRPDAVEFVVLDYASPDDLAHWITTDPELAPYRDAGILRFARSPGWRYFRHSHAKNMAHALARGEVVCNVDADNFIGAGFAEHLRGVFSRRPNAVVATHRFDPSLNDPPYKGCMGRIALSADNFARLRGYDESAHFAGWSGEDSDLLIRALKHRMRPVFIRERAFLRVVQHTDMERVERTEPSDTSAEIAKIVSLDGSSMRPILKYVVGRAVAPRRANRGVTIGAGEVRLVDLPRGA